MNADGAQDCVMSLRQPESDHQRPQSNMSRRANSVVSFSERQAIGLAAIEGLSHLCRVSFLRSSHTIAGRST